MMIASDQAHRHRQEIYLFFCFSSFMMIVDQGHGVGIFTLFSAVKKETYFFYRKNTQQSCQMIDV